MIIRVFQARPRPGLEAAYEQLMRNAAIPLMQQQVGLLGLYVGTRVPATTPAELVIVSVWEDQAALEGFTGPDWRVEVVLPGEAQLVLDTRVAIYTSLDPPPEGLAAGTDRART